MTQATYVPNIAHDNAEALAFFQNVLAAIATNNLGPTAPTETYAGMWWVDTSDGGFVVKQRNAANSAWVVFAPPNLTSAQAQAATGPDSEVFGLINGAILAGAVAEFAPGPQVFELTASGNFEMPAELIASTRFAAVELWGGGGAGGRSNSGSFGTANGGAGGSYIAFVVPCSDFAASEAFVIGAGAAGRSSNGNGGNGGGTSIMGFTAPGGGGGAGNVNTSPLAATEGTIPEVTRQALGFGAEAGGDSDGIDNDQVQNAAGSPFAAGGGGGSAERRAGNSSSSGGTSVIGGNGGAGSNSGAATSGSFPAGGGGATCGGTTSGSGGNGLIRITVL